MATGAEFGVLGPLLVRCGGQVVTIPPGKQRTLAAALLLRAGRAVSLDELAEALWGEAPPPSTSATLRNYIKRLRQALASTGHSRIETLPNGYLIRVDPGELDLSRFEALCHQARLETREGSWERAAGSLREALTLWRGEPLADVRSELLSLRDVPRLAELRQQAVQARIDADLHLGRHAAVIPELRQLTGAHPLTERLHALLMVALYRDGQQAQVLAAYQQCRRGLIAELGTEPGPALRQLERQVLAADPALALPPAAPGAAAPGAPAPAAAVPRQLPSAVRHFTGRAAELAELTTALDDAIADGRQVPLSLISGTAGVGKTALAVQWAQRVADRFADGQLYVDLRGYGDGHTEFGTAMTANDIYTIAGSATGAPGFSGDGGLATSAQLDQPEAAAVDGSLNLYIVDAANDRVREVDATTGDISTLAGSGFTLSNDGNRGSGGGRCRAGPGWEQVGLSSGAVSYLVTDQLSSVRGVVDASGALTGTTNYDAWGNPESPGGLTAKTPLGFAGGYTDPTGLVYLINRYYDPSTGQFTSVDPDVADTNDPYGYTEGDPVDDSDPTGDFERTAKEHWGVHTSKTTKQDCDTFKVMFYTHTHTQCSTRDVVKHVATGHMQAWVKWDRWNADFVVALAARAEFESESGYATPEWDWSFWRRHRGHPIYDGGEASTIYENKHVTFWKTGWYTFSTAESPAIFHNNEAWRTQLWAENRLMESSTQSVPASASS